MEALEGHRVFGALDMAAGSVVASLVSVAMALGAFGAAAVVRWP